MAGRLTERIFRDPFHQDEAGNFISGRSPDTTALRTDRTSLVRNLLRRIRSYDERGSKKSVYRGAATYEDLFTLCEAIKLWHLGLSDNSIPTSFVEALERAARPILKGKSIETRLRDLGALASEASRFIEAVVVGALQSDSVAGLELILELARSSTIEQLNIVTLNHDTLVEGYRSISATYRCATLRDCFLQEPRRRRTENLVLRTRLRSPLNSVSLDRTRTNNEAAVHDPCRGIPGRLTYRAALSARERMGSVSRYRGRPARLRPP